MHTLCGMLAIAEACPASPQCRAQLSRRREEQRKQFLWLYKIVEIGAATNFVVDQLLLTRAGENVLGLMCSLIPVLAESSCNAVILSVFERSKASLDLTPGLSQLNRVREIVAPLAARMNFKDKVLQYHAWLLKVQHSSNPVDKIKSRFSPLEDAYDGIPNESNLVEIILQFKKLVSDTDNLVLVYYGLHGAAWVVAYAQEVLDLPVCVYTDTNTTLSINGDHHSAKVLLRIYSKESRCELQRVGHVEEFIRTSSLATSSRSGWVIDAGTVNYAEMHSFGKDPNVKELYDLLAAPMTKSCMEVLAKAHYLKPGDKLWDERGFIKFSVHHLRLLIKKAMSIMKVLGFACPPTQRYDQHWSSLLCMHGHEHLVGIAHGTPHGYSGKLRAVADQTTSHLAPTQHWVDYLGESLLQPCFFYAQLPSLPRNSSMDFNDKGRQAMDCLVKAVNFACTMAFTNWGTYFRGMSVKYLQSTWDADEPHPLIYYDLVDCMLKGSPGLGFNNTELIKYAFAIVSDGQYESEIAEFADPSQNLMATSLNGMVIMRSMSFQRRSSFLQPVFLSFLPGQIMVYDQQLRVIKSNPEYFTEAAEYHVRPEREIRPFDSVKDLELISRTVIQRDALLVATDIMLGADRLQSADPIGISEAIPQMKIANPCSHDYYQIYRFPKPPAVERFTDERPPSPSFFYEAKWQGGLAFQAHLRPASMNLLGPLNVLYVQNVDDNLPGQWVACQWTAARQNWIMVLQKECCLGCVYDRVSKDSTAEVCIINGRIKDVNLSRTQSSASSRSSLQLPTEKEPRPARSSTPTPKSSAKSFEQMGLPTLNLSNRLRSRSH